ncbi:MAG: DedA family protein [Nitrospiraceae bacterium]|nr:DedA family protein [Nitrospiraceae bacterium]
MENFISSYGLLAVFVLMTLESALIPVPSEIVMPFAGVLAGLGKMNLAAAILAGTFGNLLGSYIAWAIGRTGGRALVLHFGKYVRIREEDVHRAEKWFARRGEAAVLVGRLLPVIRTFISLPAGVAEMKPVRFGVFTLIGALPWSAALALVGYAVGSNFTYVASYIKYAGYLIAVVAVVVIVRFFIKRFRSADKRLV